MISSAQHSGKDYKSTKNTNIMFKQVLVDEQDIINTYSKDEQFSCQKYFEYKKLIKENPKYGYKRCAKLLGVSQGRTRWWHTRKVQGLKDNFQYAWSSFWRWGCR